MPQQTYAMDLGRLLCVNGESRREADEGEQREQPDGSAHGTGSHPDYFFPSLSGTTVVGAPLTERPSAVTKSASLPWAWGAKKRTTSPS